MHTQEPPSRTSTSLHCTRMRTTSPPIVNEKLLTNKEFSAGPRGSTADNVDPMGPIDTLEPTRPIESLDQESTKPIHPQNNTKHKHKAKGKPKRRYMTRNKFRRRTRQKQPDTNTVVNLSSHTVAQPQTQLLSKNLNFCPTPTNINRIQLSADVHRFNRRLRLAEFFYDEEEDSVPYDLPPPFLRKASSFTPNEGRDSALDSFIKVVTTAIMTAEPKKTFSNLRNEEKKGLRELESNKDIIIKPADKGGAVVVMNTTDYISECTRQLSNTSFYKKLDSDPINSHNKILKETISDGVQEEEIDPELLKTLPVTHPKPGRFYILPMIHKEGNPGRPIISGNGCHTQVISQFVEYHIKDLVRDMPSYIQDDMDFLRKIDSINEAGPLPPDTLLCTMDVSALYTNIPNKEGIGACQAALENGRGPGSTPSATFICKLININLSQNIFTLADDIWLQTHGTAMGACMAPSYANLFMGDLERRLLDTCPDKPKVWLRYIDDIFLIWTHGHPQLDAFIQHTNTFHPSIKFTSNISTTSIPFLDVMVSLQDGVLQTDLYSKETDTFNYLHWASCHPSHTKRSIPYSLAFRLKRICSTEEALTNRLKQLTTHLSARGYPIKQITSAIAKATETDRATAIQRRQKTQTNPDRIPFVITYHPGLPSISNILKTFLPVLHSSIRCKEAIPNLPLTAHRRPKNLRDTLVQASTNNTNTATGFQPCNTPRCKTCIHTTPSRWSTSSMNNKTYNIRHTLTCKSHNVIYLITCTKCKKQYVGQTSQQLRSRFTQHRFTINSDNGYPVARHFKFDTPGHSINNQQITAIDHIPRADSIALLNKETYWIHTLRTMEPGGINTNEQTTFPVSTHRT